MKRIGIALAVVGLVLAALAIYVVSNALYTDRPVGFQVSRATDASGTPMAIGIWYPTDARPVPATLLGVNLISVARDGPVAGKGLPLVVVSHGNGGGLGSHVDLALALAQNGFVVAAPMHAGDNHGDQSALRSARWLVDRTSQLRSSLDHMLKHWSGHDRIDAARVGVFGFSAGGFTALTAVGGQPDLRRLQSHCSATPEFVCTLLRDAGSPLLGAAAVPAAGEFGRDPRLKAAVVAAPGMGFTFVPDGLKNVDVPVQLWAGTADSNVPAATNASLVGRTLGPRAEMNDVQGAGHFAFLAPCGLFGPPMLCRDDGGFDRKRFHGEMNQAVVAFFRRTLAL
jgi:predicted dienelactone hydrolase